MRERIDDVTSADGASQATVDLIVDLLVGPDDEGDGARERLIAGTSGSSPPPGIRDCARSSCGCGPSSTTLLTEVLRRSGREVRETQLRRLVAVVDGVVWVRSARSDPDPRGMARAMLSDLIDDFAPPSTR